MPSPGGTASHRLPLLVAALFKLIPTVYTHNELAHCVPSAVGIGRPRGMSFGKCSRQNLFWQLPFRYAYKFRMQVVSPLENTDTGYTHFCSRVSIRRESRLISSKKVGYSVHHLMDMDVRVLGC